MFFTTLLASAVLSHTPFVPPQSSAGAAGVAGTSEATAEGAEILRRILVGALEREFRPDDQVKIERERQGDRDARFLVTTLWAGEETVPHSRAFHLPGAGLFFALDVSLPVVKKTRNAAAEKGPRGDEERDEWERMRREVRGGERYGIIALPRGMAGSTSAEPGEIDPAAIERVIDTVLRTSARHIGRIEGLGTGESVTLALRLSGRNRGWLHELGDARGSLFRFGLGQSDDGEGDDEAPEAHSAEEGPITAYALASGDDVPDRNLVIRIPLSDLASLADGPAERLRQRAQVNLY